jgi:hypothetical protein
MYGTVKVGNFDHLYTFKVILKLFPNTFLSLTGTTLPAIIKAKKRDLLGRVEI